MWRILHHYCEDFTNISYIPFFYAQTKVSNDILINLYRYKYHIKKKTDQYALLVGGNTTDQLLL